MGEASSLMNSILSDPAQCSSLSSDPYQYSIHLKCEEPSICPFIQALTKIVTTQSQAQIPEPLGTSFKAV